MPSIDGHDAVPCGVDQVVSLHFSPGAAPQVGQSTASIFVAVSSFFMVPSTCVCALSSPRPGCATVSIRGEAMDGDNKIQKMGGTARETLNKPGL